MQDYSDAAKRARIDKEWAALVPAGWGGWNDADAYSRERRMLYSLLEDDEHLEALVGLKFSPDMRGTGGSKDSIGHGSLHVGVGVATDRRVLFLDEGGTFAQGVAEIPYASIESISYSTGVIWGALTISARVTTSLRVGTVRPKESARTFADAVRPHLIAQPNSRNRAQEPREAPSSDPRTSELSSRIDEVHQLGELLQKGLITRSEFDKKKSQLLDL